MPKLHEARSRKPAKPKAVKVALVQPYKLPTEEAQALIAKGEVPERSEPYRILERLVADHHGHLVEAKIALVWKQDVLPDKDGRLVLGTCRKASDLNREFADYDFVITLNETAWHELDARQRLALVDHELMHAQVCLEDEDTGEFKRDERGRICYRIKKHDLEEFRDIVARHGLYKDDLRAFAEVAMRHTQGTLPGMRKVVDG